VADLAAATAAGEPKVLLLDLELYEDVDQDSAGYTEVLTGQLSWIPNAVLAYDIALATYRSRRTTKPDYLFKNSVAINNPLGVMDDDASLQARKVFLPAEKLLEAKPRLGFEYENPDDDQVLRREAQIVHYEGFYYPSASLMAAALYFGVSPDEIKVDEGEGISLGNTVYVPTDGRANLFLTASSDNPFRRYSAREVLSEAFDRSVLAGKVVIITVDDIGRSELFTTPVNSETPAYLVKATAISNIIEKRFLKEETDRAATDMLILFVIGAACAFVLPRVAPLHRFLILGGGLFVLVNANYFLVANMQALHNTVYIALQLVLFMAASPLLESELLSAEAAGQTPKPEKPRSRVGAAPKPLDRAQLAKAPIRELKTSPDDSGAVATSAVPLPGEQEKFEDHSAINIDGPASDVQPGTEGDSGKTETRALESDFDDTPPGLKDNISEPATPDDIVVPEGRDLPGDLDDSDSSADELQTVLSDTDRRQVEENRPSITNLGRYQVTSVLGKGAMGLVYKGVDPAINRPVALKTIRLDFVNDPEEMEELKERLHREAQAAGKLSHPNIVTIYDVGSEGPLQYIAMECLDGVTLEDLIKKKTKFNYRIIAQIITQICAALEYAHEQGIVHRDIKPANIMILSDYRAKVMDYGIARVDSSSMTKTGIAMGTPNYISPEQLKGLPTDRRADLFSLGVVVYEMLLGRRPFKGENITSLIYSIMNNEPQKPSEVNPQVPLLFDHIIVKALKKDPAARYQRASELAGDLKDFVESFASR
jgi:serine/threonine-protein kinase